jgi:nucleoside-diphosphate-sugar epimerase
MKFTVFGASGFIGSRLMGHLVGLGHDVAAPSRGSEFALAQSGKPMGHVIYAIGLTSDFRSRPFETVNAHVALPAHLLQLGNFDSFLYLSSTRVYDGLECDLAGESTVLSVTTSADSIYNLSKLLGEALCLNGGKPAVRIARLSNVYGRGMSSSTFLGAVLADVIKDGTTCIREAPLSAKDYISVTDVCVLTTAIATTGRHQVYNLASGQNVTHAAIATELSRVTGKPVAFLAEGQLRRFPQIDTSRITAEFGFIPSRSLLDDLRGLFDMQVKKESDN